jgi:hypothetical protein
MIDIDQLSDGLGIQIHEAQFGASIQPSHKLPTEMPVNIVTTGLHVPL